MRDLPTSKANGCFRRVRRDWFWGLMFIGAAAVGGLILFFRGRDSSVASGSNSVVTARIASPVSHLVQDLAGSDQDVLADPRFVVTSNSLPPYLRMPLPGLSAAKRLELETRWKLQTPRLQNHSFPPREPNRCSIHGFLFQCTEVTGVRFAIAREVAAGSVQFGHTNTLNGAQWVRRFTEALQTNQPEWWETSTRSLRKENLVLLTRDGRCVLVIPTNLASEFQQKGFKDFRWKAKH